jgi:hypothetical protein
MGLKFGRYELSTYEVEVEGVMVTRGSVIYYNDFGKEISRERYDSPIVTDGPEPTDPVDPKPGQGVNPMFGETSMSDYLTYTINASEDFSGCDEAVTNRYIKRGGGNYTNITPFIIWTDSVLMGMALSSREAKGWIAEVRCNEKVIASLDSKGLRSNCGDYKVAVKRGDSISFFVNGENVQNPGIEAIFSALVKK